MIEKKKTHKALPAQFTLTICQSDLDMLESAISQLASREPEWRAGVRKFAVQCQMGEDAASVGFDSGYRKE